MSGSVRTFLAECYIPGIEESSVAAAATRARAAVRALVAAGERIEYLGAVLVAGDEVVFHTFGAQDPVLVERASRNAGLAFERIVESVAVDGADPGLAGQRLATAPGLRRRASRSR